MVKMEADVHVTSSLWAFILLLGMVLANIERISDDEDFDLLIPYQNLHGYRHSHRHVRDCTPFKYKNVTHETYNVSPINSSRPLISVRQFVVSDDKHKYDFDRDRYLYGHYAVIQDPLRTLSIVEPGGVGGCADVDGTSVRATTTDSARAKNCVVAVNAGFFNTTNGECLGNIITDGNMVKNSNGIQNAHFGIRKDGSLFFGYLPEYEVLHGDFQQLVGGVLWLLRNGETYLSESIASECQDTEETGTLKSFADVQSARTALGHDKNGNVVLVQVDGKTYHRGMNLYDFAEFLKGLGLINAINLDGGGSATFAINGSLANYPSDRCKDDQRFGCERKVSTIICAHEPECQPSHNCSGHGNCLGGTCICDDHWTGQSCDQLTCGVHNCSGNGVCTGVGCDCSNGWLGEQCNQTCPDNKYGRQCSEQCKCQNNATCSSIDGSCVCKTGYTGLLCSERCPYGYYGESCKSLCYCENSCSCNHITGECNITADGDSDLLQVGSCLAEARIRREHLVMDQSEQLSQLLLTVVVLSIVAASSIIINISQVCIHTVCKNNKKYKYHTLRRLPKDYYMDGEDGDDEEEEEEEEEESATETSFLTGGPSMAETSFNSKNPKSKYNHDLRS